MTDDPYESRFFERGSTSSATKLARVLKYARETAVIEPEWCWQPLDDHLGEAEAKFVRNVRKLMRKGSRGLLYLPPYDAEGQLSVAARMSLIAGTYIRNEIDARVRLVDDLMDADASSRTKDATVLLIPDFCSGPGEYTPTVTRKLRSLILDRGGRERFTVLFASSLDDVEASFGKQLREHVSIKMIGDPR